MNTKTLVRLFCLISSFCFCIQSVAAEDLRDDYALAEDSLSILWEAAAAVSEIVAVADVLAPSTLLGLMTITVNRPFVDPEALVICTHG